MRKVLLALLTLLMASTSFGAGHRPVIYSGELLADNGLPFSGTVNVSIEAYDTPMMGNLIWSQAEAEFSVVGGVLDLELGLGDQAPLMAILAGGTEIWLSFTIDGEELSPRQELTAHPYALVAGNAQRLGGTLAADFATMEDLEASNAAVSADQLPTDGINEVSNGALLNKFSDVTFEYAGDPQDIADLDPFDPIPPAMAMVDTTETAGSYLTSIAIITQFEIIATAAIKMTLTPPAASGVGPIVLQQETVVPSTNFATWTTGTTPELEMLLQKQVAGTWLLEIEDEDNNLFGTTKTGELQVFEIVYDVVRADHMVVNGRLDVMTDLNVAGDANIGGALTTDTINVTGESLTKIRNITVHEDATRRTLPATASQEMVSFTVDKKSPTSILLIDGTLCGRNDASGDIQMGWKLGDGTEVMAQTVNYDENDHGKVYPTRAVISGHATTGPQTLTFRYFSNSGGSQRPFTVLNPSSTDDNRLTQTKSVYVVWEIEP